MTEPATGTAIAIAATSVTVTSWLLGLDGNAIVGALAGAVLMVMSAKDVRWYARVLYLAISWTMGYIAAPEITEHLPIDQTGVAAFIAAALIVTVTLQTIERAKTLDVFTFWRRGGGT